MQDHKRILYRSTLFFLTFTFPQTRYCYLINTQITDNYYIGSELLTQLEKENSQLIIFITCLQRTPPVAFGNKYIYIKSEAYFLDLNQTTTSFSSPLSWCCKY